MEFAAVCALITAYIKFASAQYDAASPADQAKLAGIHTAVLVGMYTFAVKVHDDVHGVVDKLKGILPHGGSNVDQPTAV